MSFALEEAVLGSAMNDGSVIAQCAVAPNDFAFPQHRAAWDVMLRLHRQRESCDALSVAERLDAEQATPPARGWLEYLAKISRETASPSGAPAYAARLREASVLRSVQAIGKQLAEIRDVETVETQIRELIDLTRGAKDWSCHIEAAVGDALDSMQPNTARISTGLRDLDECVGGLHDGDLVVVAARPSHGKTAFALNLALASSAPVGIVSGEQGRAQIGMRMIAIDRSINLHRMRTGQLDDHEWLRVTEAMNAAKTKNIWLYDKPGPSIADVVRQARAWRYERNIGLLLVDYLQKLTGGEGENFRLQVGDTISRLKDLARELTIPVVVLAQVGRAVEKNPLGPDGLGRMPYAGDIAESGVVEQEADVIITLYRPEVYADKPDWRGIAYANVCKQREGPVGYKRLSWRGEFLRFGDLAHTEQQDAFRDPWSPP